MLPTIARHALPQRLPPHRYGAQARIILVEGGPRFCRRFPKISASTRARDLIDARRRSAHRRARHERRRRLRRDRRRSASTRTRSSGRPATPRRRSARDARRAASIGRAVCSVEPTSACPVIPRSSSSAIWPRSRRMESRCPASRRRRCRAAHCAREEHRAHRRRERARAVSLPQQGRSRDDRPLSRRSASSPGDTRRRLRVVDVAARPHHVSRRLPKSAERAAGVGVFVLHVPAGARLITGDRRSVVPERRRTCSMVA